MIEKDNKIIIKQKFMISLLVIIVTSLIVFACIVLFTFADDFMYKAVALFGLLFFLCGDIYLLIRFITQEPLVIVDEDGITDNTSLVSVGFISWNNIKSIKIINIRVRKTTSKFIHIEIDNEEEYFRNASIIKKVFMRFSIKTGYGLVNINLNASGVNVETFYNKLIEYKNNKINGSNFLQ